MQAEISDHEIARIAIEIQRSLVKKSRQSHPPIAVLVGGQPAAGKTGLISVIKQSEPERDFIEINGDDLRSWHPHYWTLLKQNDVLAADHTQKAVNAWVESLIQAAIRQQRNIIIEGTMRNPDVPFRTATLLKKNDYRVGLYAMAIPFWQSEVRIFERYERQKAQMGYGRFSNLNTHQQAFDSFIGSLEMLLASGTIDFFKAYGRDMNGLKLIYAHAEPLSDNFAQLKSVLKLVQTERQRFIGAVELNEYKLVWGYVLQKMEQRGASQEEIEKVLAIKEKTIQIYFNDAD
jgi:Zeta toxin